VTQLEDGRNNRVGTLHWSSRLLAAGSGDKNIYVYDVRTHRKVARRFHAHKQ
jgi:WD40 repeat protein